VIQGVANPSKTACSGGSQTVASNGITTVSIPGNGGATVPAVALHADQMLGGTPPTCTTVAVKFRVANANTIMGQNVHVTGNRSELGSWTASAANQLTIEGSGANVPWSRTFNLPPNTAIQFKFLKHGAVADVWERNQGTASGNREAVTAACGSATQVLDVGNFAF
jgi:alpha-amylase